MRRLFDFVSEVDFLQRFGNESDCLEFLAEEKWKGGFVCRKCGNDNYCAGKKPYSRRCTRCKHEESATAGTVFHGCKVGITDAFRMMYLVCHDPAISTYALARLLHSRQMTCWKLKKKISECLEGGGDLKLIGK